MTERLFPKWSRTWAWCTVPGTWILALRLVWEATVLTAREGPQMVGFALVHSSGILPLVLSYVFAALWSVGAVVWLGVCAWHRRAPSLADVVVLVMTATPVVALHFLPANS